MNSKQRLEDFTKMWYDNYGDCNHVWVIVSKRLHVCQNCHLEKVHIYYTDSIYQITYIQGSR